MTLTKNSGGTTDELLSRYENRQSEVEVYTPVHLVESVENCGLCVRRCLACSSCANVMYRGLAITRVLRYDASARH